MGRSDGRQGTGHGGQANVRSKPSTPDTWPKADVKSQGRTTSVGQSTHWSRSKQGQELRGGSSLSPVSHSVPQVHQDQDPRAHLTCMGCSDVQAALVTGFSFLFQKITTTDCIVKTGGALQQAPGFSGLSVLCPRREGLGSLPDICLFLPGRGCVASTAAFLLL